MYTNQLTPAIFYWLRLSGINGLFAGFSGSFTQISLFWMELFGSATVTNPYMAEFFTVQIPTRLKSHGTVNVFLLRSLGITFTKRILFSRSSSQPLSSSTTLSWPPGTIFPSVGLDFTSTGFSDNLLVTCEMEFFDLYTSLLQTS